MYRTEASILIGRTATEVFAVASDIDRMSEWQEGLVESRWTSPSAGLGATYLFVAKFAGRRWDLPGEITEWDPPRGWRWRSHGGPFPVEGGYRLDASSNGTRVTMFSESVPTGWMSVMRPILKVMGERMYRRSLARLKSVVEQSGG